MDQALNVADAAASTDGARMALLGMDIAELEAAVTGAGLQKFRARQPVSYTHLRAHETG